MVRKVRLSTFIYSYSLWLIAEVYSRHNWDQEGAIYNFDTKFVSVKDRPTFLDKTRFIKHFYTKNEPMVIHAPPHFGKSSNLKMLQMFFEIPVDATGSILANFILEKRQFFDTLLSCKDMDSFFCLDYISSHPVIYLDFNELDTEDLEAFCTSFRIMISELFQNHEYLGRSPYLDKEERTVFDNDLHPDGHPLFRNGSYALGGRDLSQLLHKHYNLSCILLIDDYDAPVSKLILEGNKDDSIDQIFKILTDLMKGLLKDNQYISHSLLTGTSHIGSVYTQAVNGLKYYSILENKTLSEFYGLKLRDVEDLLGRYGRQALLEEALHMYEGYHVLGSDEKMFAIHSFSKFMEEKRVKNFVPVPILPKLKKLFQYRKLGKIVERILGRIEGINRKFTFFTALDVKHLNNLVSKQNDKIAVETEHLMLQFLQENGCFTITSQNEQSCRIDIAVPNLEIKKILQQLIYTEKFFVDKYQISTDRLKAYALSVARLDKKEDSFQAMIYAIRAFFEKVVPETESEFEAPLYSLPKLMNNESFSQIDNEVLAPNKTKIDVLMVRKDSTLIIFEFRFNRDSSFIALLDIVNKEYFKIKTKYKARKTILVGLHFSERRDCSVSYLYNSFNITNAVSMSSR